MYSIYLSITRKDKNIHNKCDSGIKHKSKNRNFGSSPIPISEQNPGEELQPSTYFLIEQVV